MFKHLFTKKSNKVKTSELQSNFRPLEHNRKELAQLLESFRANNAGCDVLTVGELESKFQKFAAQNTLDVNLKTHYISHCSPERLQKLLAFGSYGPTISNGIKKIEKSDKEFSWELDKDVVGALFMDRGFFILVRAVNRKVGFTRRWVFDMYIATKNFA